MTQWENIPHNLEMIFYDLYQFLSERNKQNKILSVGTLAK